MMGPIQYRFHAIALLFSFVSLVSFPSMAGIITLKNGDQIHGDIIRFEAGNVVWRSENFGELSISKLKIKTIQPDSPVSVAGFNSPCWLKAMDQQELRMNCSGQEQIITLTELESSPPQPSGKSAVDYGGQLAVAGTQTRGNKSEDDFDLAAEISYRVDSIRQTVSFDYENLAKDDQAATEEYEFRYGLDWFFRSNWFWYFNAAAGVDESKRIRDRILAGSGLGWQWRDDDDVKLAMESGLEWVVEEFELPPEPVPVNFDDEKDTLTWRWALDYHYQLPFSDARFIHKHEFLFSTEEGENWEVNTDTGLKIPLGEGLFTEMLYEYDYDNQPQQNTLKKDTKWTLGVGYQW